jgi:arylsulfatase A-like enzyme
MNPGGITFRSTAGDADPHRLQSGVAPEAVRHTQRGRIVAALAGAIAVIAAVAAWWLLRPGLPGSPLPGGRATAVRDTPVVIYLIDTLRADRLGLYGYARRATSPRIDALAAESVVFEQAYSAAPWTLPSVASLITSTYSCEHSVTRDTNRLSRSLPTLAERLAGAGYATAAYYSNGYAGDIADLNRGYQIAEMRKDSNERAGDVRDFLAKSQDAPFFLYLHTMEPHQAFNVQPRFISTFGHAPLDDRENHRATWALYRELRAVDWAARRPLGTTDNTAAQEAAMAYLASLQPSVDLVYDAAVLSADEHLGQVVDVLKAAGLWDRVLFIVLADHGEEFGEHHGWTHGQSVYEELVHVPLLVHFPAGEYAGRRISDPVSLVDVMPTILDYLGRADLCAGCRGRSLLPLVDGSEGAAGFGAEGSPAAAIPQSGLKSLTQDTSDHVPSLRINEQHYFRPWKEQRGDINVVVRAGNWKAIWNAEQSAVELYDLNADAQERTNIAADQPELAARLGDQARTWYEACRGVAKPPVNRELDTRIKESLRALGYFN